MNRRFLAASAAALLASAAQAGPVTVIWSGTVTSGADYAGLFADPFTDMTGAQFVAIYQFDPAKGVTAGASTLAQAYGGTSRGVESPSLGATFSINGHSVSFTGAYFGQIYDFETHFDSQQSSEADDGDGVGMMNAVFDEEDRSYGDPSLANFSGDVSDAGYNFGWFSSGPDIGSTNLVLQNQHVRITSGLVPEPASWAMMVGGFVLIGSAMRRRPRVRFA